MSAPMTPAQLQAQFKKWGIRANYVSGWDSPRSGRDDETGLNFGPVFGFGVHHTGDDAPDGLDHKVIRDGRSDLPGPLAQFGINDSGVVDVFTYLRANHFGGGDPRVLAAVKAENYDKYPPKTTKHQGSPGAVDGNDAFYGEECYYSGGHKMTDGQYESAILVPTAICDFYGWSAKAVIGHKEWSDYKVDPGGYDMAAIRLDIQTRLDEGPEGEKEDKDKKGPRLIMQSLLTEAIQAGKDAKSEQVRDVVEALKRERRRLRRHNQ